MFQKLKALFEPNQAQIKKTDKTLALINEQKVKARNMSFHKMKERVLEMRKELKTMASFISSEEKLSVKKVDRLKGLSNKEKSIQKKTFRIPAGSLCFRQ